MATFTLAELAALSEQEIGCSEWLRITQEQVDLFADATDDHQWIHVDPARAAAGPFGGTIAHGYLTLSLVPKLLDQLLVIENVALTVNYGNERVRFTRPVPVWSRIRLHATVRGSEPRGEGLLVRVGVRVEIEGEEKPAMVGEVLFLTFGAPSG